MPGIPTFVLNSGFPTVMAFLCVIVCLRSQGTYWLGRAFTHGLLSQGRHSRYRWVQRLRAWLEGASVQDGVAAVDRWGLVVIPLSFLTIGFQTVIHAASGVLRLRWLLYTLVAIPGYLVWGALYAAIFVSAYHTGQAFLIGKTWAVWISTIAVVTILAFLILRYRTRLRRQTTTSQ